MVKSKNVNTVCLNNEVFVVCMRIKGLLFIISERLVFAWTSEAGKKGAKVFEYSKIPVDTIRLYY